MRAVEKAVRGAVRSMRDDGRLVPDLEPAAAVAIRLAKRVDDSDGADIDAAKELRLTLEVLRKKERRQVGDSFEEWARQLSSGVGDPEDIDA